MIKRHFSFLFPPGIKHAFKFLMSLMGFVVPLNIVEAQLVIDEATTEPVQVADGGRLIVLESGSVNVEMRGDAVTGIGSIAVENEGLISGFNRGVSGDTIISLFNGGTIIGLDSNGVGAEVIGDITNRGIILGGGAGVFSRNAISSLTNSGTISDGVRAKDVFQLGNSGLIGGMVVGNTLHDISNNGIITADIRAIRSSVITNFHNTGDITGGDDGILAGTITSLINEGTIVGEGRFGAAIHSDLIVSLNNSGRISGEFYGVEVDNLKKLSNSGMIEGRIGGVDAETIEMLSNSGTIEGLGSGIDTDTLSRLINSGLISGGGRFGNGIEVDNLLPYLENSGTIMGGINGVDVSSSIVYLSNSGMIEGGRAGVFAQDFIESLDNTGVISGGEDGIHTDRLISLTNSGTITGGDDGIAAISIDNVNNSGTITGGVVASDTIFSLENSGTINGGVNTMTLSSLSNSGLIQGSVIADTLIALSNTGMLVGGVLTDRADNLFNSGTITGGNYGVDAETVENLENNGTISGRFNGVYVSRTLMNLNNSGLIAGDERDGVFADTLVGLINSGTISGSDGVEASLLTRLINSGSIIGKRGGVRAETIESLVNSGLITSNDDGIFARNVISLNNSGSIVGGGLFGDGVDAGNLASLTNSGRIAGEGRFGDGIDVGSSIASLINSGMITSENSGVDASVSIEFLDNSGTIEGGRYGVYASELIEHVNNSGTIFGGELGAIYSLNTVGSLINNGMILGGGGSASGVRGTTIESISNRGFIEGGANGIRATTIVSLDNSGTISGRNEGILAQEITKMSNSGKIVGGSKGLAVGGFFGGSSTIINSGTIEGRNAAIDLLSPDADILFLEAGSRIIGPVVLVGSNDAIHFGDGLSAVVNLTGSEPGTTSFSSPLNFSDDITRAQADVSSFTALDSVLDDLTNGVGAIVRSRLASVAIPAGEGSSEFGMSNYWISGWGASTTTEGFSSNPDVSHRVGGSLFGVDWALDDDDFVGLYSGLGTGGISVDVSNGQEIDTKSFYAGAYAKKSFGEGFFTADFLLARLDFESERIVGASIAVSDYDAWVFAPTIAYSRNFHVADRILVGGVSLGYAGLFAEGYSESGTAGNISVGSRDIHQLTVRTEFSYIIEGTSQTDGNSYSFAPYGGMEGRFKLGDDEVTASLLGNSVTFDPSGDAEVGNVFVGARFNSAVASSVALFGGIELSYDTASGSGAHGHFGVSIEF